MPKAETRLQRKIVEYLNANGFFAFKMPGTIFLRGMPDVFAVRDGRLYCFEVKTEKGKTTKLQEVLIAKFKQYGATCAVVRSVEEVRMLIAA